MVSQGKDVSKKKTWQMTESKACDVALFTFSPNSMSCNGGLSAWRRLRYEQKLKLPINCKSTSHNQHFFALKICLFIKIWKWIALAKEDPPLDAMTVDYISKHMKTSKICLLILSISENHKRASASKVSGCYLDYKISESIYTYQLRFCFILSLNIPTSDEINTFLTCISCLSGDFDQTSSAPHSPIFSRSCRLLIMKNRHKNLTMN